MDTPRSPLPGLGEHQPQLPALVPCSVLGAKQPPMGLQSLGTVGTVSVAVSMCSSGLFAGA